MANSPFERQECPKSYNPDIRPSSLFSEHLNALFKAFAVTRLGGVFAKSEGKQGARFNFRVRWSVSAAVTDLIQFRIGVHNPLTLPPTILLNNTQKPSGFA